MYTLSISKGLPWMIRPVQRWRTAIPITSLFSTVLSRRSISLSNDGKSNISVVQYKKPHNHDQRYCQQQLRFKNSSKIGHMKETLDELAHRPEREAAKERREKKKAKAAASKKGGEKTTTTAITSAATTTKNSGKGVVGSPNVVGGDDLYFDDLDEEDDDDEGDGQQKDSSADGGEDIEPTLPDLVQVEMKMMAYVDRFYENLKSIRGAEPTPELFDDISVLAYGSPTPLKVVGQVVILSPTMAQITCFDPSLAKDVQKAIQLSLDQLNPQLEEGGTIKIPLPRISMEIREQTAKQLKTKTEATKQRIRQVRRKAMDIIKKGKDGKLSGISKDDAFTCSKDLDTLTETVMERLDKIMDEKMKSIMAV